jgi:hypothetical protein
MNDDEIVDRAVKRKREVAREFGKQKKDYALCSLETFRNMGLIGEDLERAVSMVDLAIGIGRIQVQQELKLVREKKEVKQGMECGGMLN